MKKEQNVKTAEIAEQASLMDMWAQLQAGLPQGVVLSGWSGQVGQAPVSEDEPMARRVGEQGMAQWLQEVEQQEVAVDASASLRRIMGGRIAKARRCSGWVG